MGRDKEVPKILQVAELRPKQGLQHATPGWALTHQTALILGKLREGLFPEGKRKRVFSPREEERERIKDVNLTGCSPGGI